VQIEQRSENNARMRFHGQSIARSTIQHPRRHRKEKTIAQLDDVTLLGMSSQATHDVAFLVEERMMPVADSHRP
jgi:hypothetical protein